MSTKNLFLFSWSRGLKSLFLPPFEFLIKLPPPLLDWFKGESENGLIFLCKREELSEEWGVLDAYFCVPEKFLVCQDLRVALMHALTMYTRGNLMGGYALYSVSQPEYKDLWSYARHVVAALKVDAK